MSKSRSKQRRRRSRLSPLTAKGLPRMNNKYCACGQPGSHRVGGDPVCERCFSIMSARWRMPLRLRTTAKVRREVMLASGGYFSDEDYHSEIGFGSYQQFLAKHPEFESNDHK